MESIIKKMCQELDNNKLFNTSLRIAPPSDVSEGAVFSEDEIEEINKKYNFDLIDAIENNEQEFFRCLFLYINGHKLNSIEDWLESWAYYDDIALVDYRDYDPNDSDLYGDIEEEDFVNGKFAYGEWNDNYMQNIIPGVLDLYKKYCK